MSSHVELWKPSGPEVVALSGDRLSMGKAPENDIVVADHTVSRLHAVLEHFPSGWSIRDLGSRNGTFVNGERIFAEKALRPGDEIRLGETRLVYRQDVVPDQPSITGTAEAAPELTARERDVLLSLCRPVLSGSLLTDPTSIRDIAVAVGVTEPAVKKHLERLYDKFDLADSERRRGRLANEAIRRGAVSLADVGAADGAPATAATPARPEATLRREGDVWVVGFSGDILRLQDAKGIRFLHHLLATPGREIHVLDLAGLEGERRVHVVDAGLHPGAGDAGELLDREAKSAYRARLAELREEIDEAEAFGDIERGARAKAEMDAIAVELSRAVGLGGRDRRAASMAERARVNITRTIRAAIRRIEEELPALGRHLQDAVRTGTFCSYDPDPRSAPHWRL